MNKIIAIKDLKNNEVPEKLKREYYFDFNAYPFEHKKLFGIKNNIVETVYEIGNYVKQWLKDTIDSKVPFRKAFRISDKNINVSGKFEVFLEKDVLFKPANIIGKVNDDDRTHRIYIEKGVSIFGGNLFLDKGDIYIGENSIIEPGIGIKGPAIIGKKTIIRQGAYLRGNTIIGNECILRGEIKNAVMLDKANFSHPSYVGDSICGYQSHFGNQATTANLGIFEGIRDKNKRKNIILRIAGKLYDTGKSKLGIILGDFSQVGCNSVSDPGVFLAPYTIVYSLTQIQKGFYGPKEILKNKAFEKGIIEISALK